MDDKESPLPQLFDIFLGTFTMLAMTKTEKRKHQNVRKWVGMVLEEEVNQRSS